MSLICPKCGFESNNPHDFIGPFCKNCVHFNIDFNPILSFTTCSYCGRTKIGKNWKNITKKDITRAIKSNVKGKYDRFEVDFSNNQVIFFKNIGNNEFEQGFSYTIKHNPTTCSFCSRKMGNYHEAIIQIRGKPSNKKLKQLLVNLEKLDVILKLDETKDGLDIYIIDKKKLVSIFSALSFKYTRSETLVGMKNGKRLYRSTFCIRF